MKYQLGCACGRGSIFEKLDLANSMAQSDPRTRTYTAHNMLTVMLVLFLAEAAAGQRQLGATVMVNGFGDLEGSARGSGLPVCQYTLQRARTISTSVSFALAVFPMAPDKESLDSWTYKDASGNHAPASPANIARWQSGLQQCFKFAIDQGFKDIHILLHFDPLHPVLLRPTTWRNLINIGAKTRAAEDSLSFNDVMLKPVTAALAAVANPSVNLWYSVSGEMTLSNFLNPREWMSVLQETRALLKQKPWKSVRVATALNWQMVCGCVAASDPLGGTFDPVRYNSSFAAEFAQVRQHALPLAKAFKALLDDNDFLALSAYGSGYPTDAAQLTYRSAEIPLYTLAYELSFFGIDLKAYMDRPVLYVEQGLGGVLRYGVLPAPDLTFVAKYPMSGNWPHNGYTKEVDPWQRADFATYRRKFYQATVDLLQRGRGDQFKLDGAYVWSVGSFDVFGVHPVSTSSEGSFADNSIIAMTKKLNGVA